MFIKIFQYYVEYLKNLTDASFNFEHVANSAVLHFINKLKPSNSSEREKLAARMSTIIAKEVSLCISLIINQTLVYLRASQKQRKLFLFTKRIPKHY